MAKHKRGSVDLSKASPDQIVKAFAGKIDILSKVGEGMAVSVVSTNLRLLDKALGIGGLPCGRIVELYGPEASGKTSLACHFIACVQKAEGKAALIDAEHAIDPEMLDWFGADSDKLLFRQPDSGEEALNLVYDLSHSRAADIIVVDSVAALEPMSTQDRAIGEVLPGAQARMMSDALRQIQPIVSRSNTILVFINQTRMKIGVRFGNPETTPGGKALRFYAGVRMEVRKTGAVKKGGKIVGIDTKVKIVKNKVATPFKACSLRLLIGKGWSCDAGGSEGDED